MFAILINEENMTKIIDLDTVDEANAISIARYYLKKQFQWYFIRDYVARLGQNMGWVILPSANFKLHFDHDEEAIKTDWVEVTRKPGITR